MYIFSKLKFGKLNQHKIRSNFLKILLTQSKGTPFQLKNIQSKLTVTIHRPQVSGIKNLDIQ